MTKSIYGLNYETTMNVGLSMLFTKDILWLEQDLISMEKRMLLNYPISRLLPLELKEMNMQITLAYKLGAKKSLNHLAQNRTLNEMDCFRILLSIVTTLIDSKVHLLSEERYLLQESFIYIGTDYLDIHLIYLPIYDLADKPLLPMELLNLLVFLLRKQGKAKSQNVIEIKQLLNAADFQLLALKARLLQYITEIDSPMTDPSPLVYSPQLPRLQSRSDLKEMMPVAVHSTESWIPLTAKEKFLKWRLPRSHNPLLFTATIFIIGVIWVFYIYYASVGLFNLSLGLSLLILNISLWMNRYLGTMETGELSYINSPSSHIELQFPLSETNYYEQLGNQTTLLAPKNALSDATVLLTPPLKSYLELRQGDETELIKISSENFIIGRNEEAAQFTANWIGLSRSHIMITSLGNNYEVKDLGSKNGSFLNEEIMIPHQNYPLNEGDCIKIVEKQFIYKRL